MYIINTTSIHRASFSEWLKKYRTKEKKKKNIAYIACIVVCVTCHNLLDDFAAACRVFPISAHARHRNSASLYTLQAHTETHRERHTAQPSAGDACRQPCVTNNGTFGRACSLEQRTAAAVHVQHFFPRASQARQGKRPNAQHTQSQRAEQSQSARRRRHSRRVRAMLMFY